MLKYIPYILSFLFLNVIPATAQEDTVLQKLEKRYGKAYAWGNGYVIEANSVYAFANNDGVLVRPFTMNSFDTLLPDRAVAYGVNRCSGYYLINADGEDIGGCSSKPYRLVNREKRLLAYMLEPEKELLFDDSGRQLTYSTHHRALPNNGFLRVSARHDKPQLYGIVTKQLDTFLTPDYKSISYGKDIYAGVRNDTAYVYRRGRGLLFSLPGVNDCTILQNDMISINKYGMSALVNETGQVLTDFRYLKIEDFNYAYSIMPVDWRGRPQNPPVVKEYAIVSMGPKGLIDRDGREVLPLVYDYIAMGTNSWFIVRKVMQDHEYLLDEDFKQVLKAEAYDMTFIDSRYVTITKTKLYSNEVEVRHYDMARRKFTKRIPPEKAPIPRPHVNSHPQSVHLRDRPDTIYINKAGSALVHSDNKWGVVSITGDTILPFVYDTAGKDRCHYVGLNNKFAILDAEGNLATPVSLPEPAFMVLDSFVLMKDKTVYSYRTGVLHKVDTNVVPDGADLKFVGGMAWIDQYFGWLKPGIYNRRLQLLAPKPLNKRGGIMSSGIVAITDSAEKKIAVIDSTGRQLIPWMLKPTQFRLYDSTALAINDSGEADVLYRINSGIVKIDTVWVDKNKDGSPIEYYSQYLQFSMQGYHVVAQFIRSGQLLMDPGIEAIWSKGSYLFYKKNNKVGLRYRSGEVILPAIYDSLKAGNGYERVVTIYDEGKVGMYDIAEGRTYPPVYDSINYPSSIYNGFFIGYQQGKTLFIDKNNKVISSGLDIEPGNYSVIGGIEAVKDGVTYRLYPTLGNTLDVRADNILPVGYDATDTYMDGYAIVKKKAQTGVYDIAAKNWLIPANYVTVEREDDYFIARRFKGSAELTAVYTVSGQQLFEIEGFFAPQRLYYFKQWAMNGWYRPPVVNDEGKVIVADTFKRVFSFAGPGRPFYQAITHGDKRALIDTSGKIVIPAELTYIVDDSWMYNGYFTVWKDSYARLISPRGEVITGYEYMKIFSAMVLTSIPTRTHPPTLEYYPPEPEDNIPRFIVSKTDTSSFGVIDSTGNILIPCVYDSIKQVYKGKIVVAKKDNKWGLVTLLQNKPVTGFKYDSIDIFNFGYALFRRGDISGVLHDDGTEKIRDK